MTLLERIKELRERNGNISINKLEKEAGLTRGSMSKWDDHAPSYEKLKKVANYFGIPVEYLLTGEENADIIINEVSQYEAILAWTVEQEDVPDRVKDVIQSEIPPSSMGSLAALIDQGQKEKDPTPERDEVLQAIYDIAKSMTPSELALWIEKAKQIKEL